MADPQKLMPTTRTYMKAKSPPVHYKSPRPYSAEPVVTVRSNVPGTPTRGFNTSRPPLCTGNPYRKPTRDYDERTTRIRRNNDNTINTKESPLAKGSL